MMSGGSASGGLAAQQRLTASPAGGVGDEEPRAAGQCRANERDGIRGADRRGDTKTQPGRLRNGLRRHRQARHFRVIGIGIGVRLRPDGKLFVGAEQIPTEFG